MSALDPLPLLRRSVASSASAARALAIWGVGSLFGLAVHACGEKTEDAVASGGQAGAGGSSGGGSGGAGASSGSGGGGGSCPCPDWDVGGVRYIQGCCQPGSGKCGYALDSGDISGVKPGCYPDEQPGALDPSCPPLEYAGGTATRPGCCRASTGSCGVWIDTSLNSEPRFGCLDPGSLDAGAQSCGGDCTTCRLAKCGGKIDYCMSSKSCRQAWICASACGGQFCVDLCLGSNQSGASAYLMLAECFGQQCSTECG